MNVLVMLSLEVQGQRSQVVHNLEYTECSWVPPDGSTNDSINPTLLIRGSPSVREWQQGAFGELSRCYLTLIGRVQMQIRPRPAREKVQSRGEMKTLVLGPVLSKYLLYYRRFLRPVLGLAAGPDRDRYRTQFFIHTATGMVCTICAALHTLTLSATLCCKFEVYLVSIDQLFPSRKKPNFQCTCVRDSQLQLTV